MNRPVGYTIGGAQAFTQTVWNLYTEMSRKFGDEKAWEFVLNFYEGAGRGEGS